MDLAYVVARFCRFYGGYRAEDVLKMPVTRFFVMYRMIQRLEAEEALAQLSITHGNPERVRDALLNSIGHEKRPDINVKPGLTPGTMVIDDGDKLKQELERKRREWRERQKNRDTNARNRSQA